MNLRTLIAKLEATTGPDRELDAEVYVACKFGVFASTNHGHFELTRADGRRTLRVFADDGRGPYTPYEAEDVSCMVGWDCFTVPPYTASIDAAVALAERVLPGLRWGIDYDNLETRAYVTMLRRERPSVIIGYHPSPAIALVIAILRAKQAEERK